MTEPRFGTPAANGEVDGRPDFLVALGVLWPCTIDDVKQAFLARAKRLHPDKGGDPAAFIALQQAYDRALEYAQFHGGRTAWLASTVERYLERQALTEAIERRGGQVQLESVDWLRRELGDDFAQLLDTIGSISLTGPRVDDDTLAWLHDEARHLPALHTLDLADSRVTDRGLPMLAALSSLRRVDLHRTQVTARGLSALEGLTNLRALGLMGTRLGWWGRRRLQARFPGVTLLTD